MSRRRASTVSFDAIAIEGAFITTDMLALVAAIQASEQTEADYDTPPGLTLRDEIGRYYRIGEALWVTFERLREKDQGGVVTVNFVTQLLTKVFGFSTLAPSEPPTIAGRVFPVRYSALDSRVPLVIAPAPDGIDKGLPQFGDGYRRRSATLLLQEFLNASDRRLFGLVTDGCLVRLMRNNTSMTRPAWTEADLERIFENGLFADFSALWLLIHQSRFGKVGSPPSDCAIERWREKGREQGVAARERLRDSVKEALKALGEGFLQYPNNTALVHVLETGELDAHGYFQELLRTVYRFIFLFTAEDRSLLRPNDQEETSEAKLYSEGYSLTRLRTKAVRSLARDRHHDLWDGMRIVFRGLARGEKRLALPALGGLFAPDRTPHLDAARIENRYLLAVIDDLAWIREDGARMRINWRNMETEELGSVYESLLELTPRASASERTFSFADDDEARGNERKKSGSYYTPDPLVQIVLDSALDPIIDETIAKNPDREADALLDLNVIDPAVGSGHFLLAAARRLATRVAQLRSPGSPSAEDYRHALREVARHCLYGVDRNPMAVELCKVAIWIETVEPGKPLSFLDNRIRLGDSLIGVFDLKMLTAGIPDEAYKPLAGDEKAVASYYRKLNRAQRDGKKDQLRLTFAGAPTELADAFAAVDAMPEDNVEDVSAKAFADAAARGKTGWWQLKTACDLFVSAFFVPKTGQLPDRTGDGRSDTDQHIPTTDAIWRALQGGVPSHQLVVQAIDVAGSVPAFHWPLEFPDVMRNGGFDVVIGNPPWETMSPDAKEFFATFDHEVRFMSPEDQKAAYNRILETPVIAESWNSYCRDLYRQVQFYKESGRYRLFAPGNLGKGDLNVYRMFVETALSVVKSGGYAAQIVPDGLYNGANSAAIRQFLFESCKLVQLIGFQNLKRVWFPEVYYRMKFCMYLVKKGERTETFKALFGILAADQLKSIPDNAILEIPVSLVREFSPDAMAIMEFAAQEDISICRKMYARYPKFGEKVDGLPYRSYMAEVHMGSNRNLFTENSDGLPVFEGRMVDSYDYRAKGYASGRGRSADWVDLPFGSADKAILPQWRILPEAIPDKLCGRIDKYRIGFCDVASSTNERGLFAALIPPNTICGDKVPTLLLDCAAYSDLMLWLGVANSLTMDFVVRKKVALKMSYTIMDSLPFPRDWATTSAARDIAERVLALCAVGQDMNDFRLLVQREGRIHCPSAGVESADRRARLMAEIDALVAHEVYGLTRKEMLYILDPANLLGEDCGIETFKALKNREIREYREYRTQRFVLEAWDNLVTKEKVA
jgi:N-6 DNA Methylase